MTPEDFPTDLLSTDPASGLNALMRDTDWAATLLGPVDTWSPELRTVVGVCLNSPFPMLLMWGPDLAMLYNDAFVPILGAKHPALGLPCDQVWADAWPVVGGMVDAVVEHGEATYHQDLPMTIHRHGFDETVYFTFAYSAVPARSGGVGGVLTVVTETTRQVLDTRRLRALGELGGARSAQVSDARQACTVAMRILEGYRADVPFGAVHLVDEHSGQSTVVASYEAPEPADSAWIQQALTSGDAVDGPGAVALPLTGASNGRPYGVLVLGVSPDLVLDETYRGFLGLVADHLTAALADAEAQASQLRRAEELAELDRAKTKFFTGVSHELRTPLTLIAGPARDALADASTPLPPAQRQRLEIIGRNAARLRRLVDTLLDFSRIEDGRLRPEPVAVELGALTRGIAQSFAPAVERAGLRFMIDCPPGPTAVLVDPALWERIVLNLLSNAVKFTPHGGISIRLSITYTIIELTVSDTGVGIPPAELPHLFERFHQVRGTTGRSHEGSGIGLALVRELAGLHDGHAEATSTLGEGTALTVSIPARPAKTPITHLPSNAVDDYVAEALQWSAPTPTPDTVPHRTDTVLIAEDNADLRTYLTGLLEPAYTVVVTSDGRQALAEARRLRPDLVLADVMMPGLDGFGLLRALRADPATAGTPVVFLSARAGEEAAAEGLAAGADDYLAKPFSSTDLLARIRSNVDLARLRNQESAWRTALVNAMQDGFFVSTSDLTVVEVNEGFTQLLGYEASRLPCPAPHPWWPTAEQDPEGHALLEDVLTRIRTNDGRGRFVLPLRHQDGRRLWVDVSLDSLTDRHSGARLLVGTLRDVTTQHLTSERDAAVARLAELLTGVDDSDQLLHVGLAELRDCWQARRISLLRLDDPGVTVTATTGPTAPTGDELPPPHTGELVREGNLFSFSDGGVTTVGAPLYDGSEHALLWLEFDRPRPFTDADRALTVQLTAHLQRALGRTRAADEQRQVAVALQRAILGPAELPAGFAVRYEPASSTLEVGGDWYDVVELPHQRYGVVVGDVVGSGLPAATIMGQLRSAARALLLENSGPASVLTALDRFADLLPGAFCTTVFCAVIDPHTRTMHYSSAGHLPALLAEPDTAVRRLDHAQSPPLAVRSGRERPEATTTIASGSTLLLYTDGLVERRREGIDAGIDRAAKALAGVLQLGPDAAVDEVCAALIGKEQHEDDVALLLYHQL